MSIDIGCPKCGCVSTAAPPASTHEGYTTEKPDNVSDKYIVRTIICLDCKKPESRRLRHDFTVYWYNAMTK